MTGYFPVKSAAGTFGVLFIGIPMEVYYSSLQQLLTLVVGVGLAVLLIVGIIAYVAIRATIRPLETLTGAINTISAGNLDTKIPCTEKENEFGAIGKALALFQDGARARLTLETQAAEQRAFSDAERSRNDAEKRTLDDQIQFAVTELAAGLGRLSRGDVSETIETPFVGRLEQLRVDFNASLERLQDTLSRIRDNAATIHRNSGSMLHSADELSKRTEAQAASLEETAAAVEESPSPSALRPNAPARQTAPSSSPRRRRTARLSWSATPLPRWTASKRRQSRSNRSSRSSTTSPSRPTSWR